MKLRFQEIMGIRAAAMAALAFPGAILALTASATGRMTLFQAGFALLPIAIAGGIILVITEMTIQPEARRPGGLEGTGEPTLAPGGVPNRRGQGHTSKRRRRESKMRKPEGAGGTGWRRPSAGSATTTSGATSMPTRARRPSAPPRGAEGRLGTP